MYDFFWQGSSKTYWCLRWGWSQTYWSCAEVRAGSGGWWETNYGGVIWTNRMWACAGEVAPSENRMMISSETDRPVCLPANPSSHNTITQMLLILCTSVIPHFHHCLCQPFTISPSLSPLCVASHASGRWIIDGMLSLRDFSCRRLVCWSGCVLSSLTTVTLHLRACVCTPPLWVCICVWLIKSPDALLEELQISKCACFETSVGFSRRMSSMQRK